MNHFTSVVGEHIKALRTDKRLSQAELALLIQSDAPSVSRWERGVHSPSIEVIYKLCDALDVPLRKVLPVLHFPRVEALHEERAAYSGGDGAKLAVLIGKNIKAFRRSKKLTQTELGNLIEVDAPALSRWERGVHSPSIEALYTISDQLNVPLLLLLPPIHTPAKARLRSLKADLALVIPYIEDLALIEAIARLIVDAQGTKFEALED
ncbi:Antitoxin PezA [compost metagenome]